MFGKKKLDAKSEMRKTLILNAIDNIMHSTDYSVTSELRGIYTEIKSHPNSLSNEIVYLDAKILSYLNEIENDVASKSNEVAAIRIKCLDNAVRLRGKVSKGTSVSLMTAEEIKIRKATEKEIAKISKKKGYLNLEEINLKVGDKYTDNELFDIYLASMQDEVNKIRGELSEVEGKYAANPENQSLAIKQRTLRINLKAAEENLVNYGAESERETYLKALGKLNETQKERISKRTYSDAEAEVIKKEYVELKRKQASDPIGEDIENFLSGTLGSDTAASFGVATDSGATSAKNPSKDEIVRQYNNIGNVLNSLKNTREKFQERIRELSQSMDENGKEALSLIELRKGYTAAQCKSIDPQIRSLKSEYVRMGNSIKQYEQQIIDLDNKISQANDMLERVNMHKTDSVGSNIGGKIDWEKLATDLRDLTIQANETLDNSNTAYSVSTSVDINVESASSVGQLNAGITGEKNENEFSDFEAELKARGGDTNG